MVTAIPNKQSSTSSVNDVVIDGGNTTSSDDKNDEHNTFYSWAWIGVCGYVIHRLIYFAYQIRMHAIDEYGPVIHEFDPYFNYRATEVRKYLLKFNYTIIRQ